MDSLRVAVIGIGHLGARHLEILAGLKRIVKLTGICDSDPCKTAQPAKKFKIPAFKDYRELTGKVDAVHICVPTSKHYEIAKFFLNQGVHTFIEKPMTLTVAEADELIELADRQNVKLQIGHVERFNSAFMAIRHFCKEPLFIECHRLNRFPNRSLDIGVVMDLMIHDIDIVLGLNNCGIKDFHAVGVPVLTPQEDIANARIIFDNGCVCNLTASRVSEEVVRKIRIFLKDTYISLDYIKQEAWIYKKHGMMISKHALPIEKEEPLKKEITSFIDCIRKDQTPLVSGREGREALKLALTIGESLKNFGAAEKKLLV